MRRALCLPGAVALASLLAAGACAQGYPAHPVRIVVPYPPGGGTDVVARTVAQKFNELLGQPAIVDNRAGANGIIGTDLVAKSKPDGYTVLVTIATHAINPSLYARLPYDAADLAPVSQLTEYPFVITVHPSLPARSIRELIAFAKAHPGELSYASSGNGSGPHLGMELLLSMTGTRMVHVPYKGAGAAMTDLISGQVQVFLNNFLSSMPLIKAGRLRALAVTSPRRSSAMPELPTVAEAGVPGYSVTGWHAMLVPAGTPAPIMAALHDVAAKSLRSKEISERLAGEATEVIVSTPQQFAQFLKRETDKWAAVIRKAGVRSETY